jgi:hypothetical protein
MMPELMAIQHTQEVAPTPLEFKTFHYPSVAT